MTKTVKPFNFPLAIITATIDEFISVYTRFIMNKEFMIFAKQSSPLYSGELNKHLVYSKPFACFEINKNIFCVLSSFGKINAAAATQWAIDKLNAKSIINFGAAAGISLKSSVGDCYIPHTLYDHQYKSEGSSITLDEESKKIYKYLIKNYLEIKKGIIVSGDENIDTKQKREYLREKYMADCADWESYAVFKTASKNDIPCQIIRVISDMGNEDFYHDYWTNLPEILTKGTDLLYRILFT